MKLNTDHWQTAMPNRHDFLLARGGSAPGRHFKFGRQRRRVNHQAVIPGGRDRVRQSCKDPAAVVMDLVGLAVHQSFGANNRAAIRLANRLMAQADT